MTEEFKKPEYIFVDVQKNEKLSKREKSVKGTGVMVIDYITKKKRTLYSRSSHKLCYGRAISGWNKQGDVEIPIICNCVLNQMTRTENLLDSNKLVAEESKVVKESIDTKNEEVHV